MSDAETMQSGPGVVVQRSWKPLGFLPNSVQWALGFGLKTGLAVYSHGLYDLVKLGHEIMPIPNLFTADGWNALGKDMVDHKEYWLAKGGGIVGNYATNAGGARDNTEDSWSAYAMRKVIPGVLYCALMGAIYGTMFPAALTSFIITTAMTDIPYKVFGEMLLGLPHIKS
jgi:hypothetical protein